MQLLTIPVNYPIYI